MSFVKRTLVLVVVLVVFFTVILASSQNSDPVALRFLDWETWQWPISFWMLTAFVLGVVLTYSFSWWGMTKLRLQARKANKQVSLARQDLDKAKAESTSTPQLEQS